jgi:hypothetical protein
MASVYVITTEIKMSDRQAYRNAGNTMTRAQKYRLYTDLTNGGRCDKPLRIDAVAELCSEEGRVIASGPLISGNGIAEVKIVNVKEKNRHPYRDQPEDGQAFYGLGDRSLGYVPH